MWNPRSLSSGPDDVYLLISWGIVQVLVAHFEKIGSRTFAVYIIQVKDTENRTWQIQRRYGLAAIKRANRFLNGNHKFLGFKEVF